MRIKLEYIEVQMLIAGLDAMHLPTIMHDEVKKKLKRRLERMERDYTGSYADTAIGKKIEAAVDKVDANGKIKSWTEITV